MKKFKLFRNPAVLKDIAVSTCLVGASAGVVFGVSAGMFKVQYMPLNSAEARLAAATSTSYISEDIESAWNMNGGENMKATEQPEHHYFLDPKDPTAAKKARELWMKIHNNSTPVWEKAEKAEPNTEEGTTISEEAIKARHELTAMVIDGATHTTMDRSFNQSLYEGLVDYIKNAKQTQYDAENLPDPISKNTALAYKPGQDNTTEFVNIYLSVIEHHTVLGLAGFNHSTPLNSLMTHKELPDGTLDPLVSASDEKINKEINETVFILVDANVPNNQNVASVQFRADQPGFLAALSTCQYFYNNLDLYHDHFQDLSVAAFGGVQIPTVLIYMGGFQRGVELFNYQVLGNILKYGPKLYYDKETPEPVQEQYLTYFTNLVEHSKYKEELKEITSSADFSDEMKQKLYDEYSVKMIKLGGIGDHFSGTFASGDAIGITKQYLNRGASAIIAVAGPQSLDTAQEIRNQNSKCIVVGVDTAMENSDYQRFHEGCDESSREKHNTNDAYMDKTVAPDGSTPENANGVIKFSAQKDIKKAVNQITRLSLQGYAYDKFIDENEYGVKRPDRYKAICGPGYQTCGNILNGLISVSWDGLYPLLQALEAMEFKQTGATPKVTHMSSSFKTCVDHYFNVANPRPDQEYQDLLTQPDGFKTICTFDKNSKNGQILYRNFNHTMSIIGQFLNGTIGEGFLLEIPFDRTMTLSKNKDGTYRMLNEGEVKEMPILDWLEENMYVTC